MFALFRFTHFTWLYLVLLGCTSEKEHTLGHTYYILDLWTISGLPPTPLEHGKNTVFFDLFSRIGLKGKAVVETQRVVTMVNANCWLRIVEYRPQRVMQYDAILLKLVASTSQPVVCHCLSNCVSSNSQSRPRNSASEPRIARRCTAILRLSSCSWARAHRWLVKHWTQQLTPKGLMSMRLAP